LVHFEQLDSGSTCRGQAGNFTFEVDEVVAPILQSRMKQSGDFLGVWVEAGEIRPFVKIAVMARQGEVSRVVCASVLTCRDVLDVKRQWFQKLRQRAVFAAVPCPLPNELTHPGFDHLAPP
jgi:hypothetical protein